MMMLLLRAFAVVWVAAAAKHPHNEALKVADYVREVRDQLHNDGQPAAAAPSGKGWPDAAAKAAAMERIAAAAEERRLAIRRHYGLEGTPDAERWLDEAIGFTKEEAKAFTIEKLRAAVERGGPLRIGVMGISVTAGHDCHYSQSFPLVFARHFGRALDAGGVELVMRNHAIGGFGVMPSHFCTQTMVGADNDVVAWDYQMMAPRFDCRVEQWARAFALSAAQPAMLYWQGGLYLAKDGTLKEKDLLAPSKNDKQSCGNRWVVNGYASIVADQDGSRSPDGSVPEDAVATPTDIEGAEQREIAEPCARFPCCGFRRRPENRTVPGPTSICGYAIRGDCGG